MFASEQLDCVSCVKGTVPTILSETVCKDYRQGSDQKGGEREGIHIDETLGAHLHKPKLPRPPSTVDPLALPYTNGEITPVHLFQRDRGQSEQRRLVG